MSNLIMKSNRSASYVEPLWIHRHRKYSINDTKGSDEVNCTTLSIDRVITLYALFTSMIIIPFDQYCYIPYSLCNFIPTKSEFRMVIGSVTFVLSSVSISSPACDDDNNVGDDDTSEDDRTSLLLLFFSSSHFYKYISSCFCCGSAFFILLNSNFLRFRSERIVFIFISELFLKR